MEDNNFKNLILKGTFYTAIAKYSNIVISIIVTSILSRILTPEIFGIIAIATIFINFFSLMTTMGISPAIIQSKELNEEDIKSLYSFTFYLGSFISAIFIFLSPFIARFYNNNILSTICILLSINIFFSTLTIVPNALYLKEKNFKFIAVRTFIVQVIIGGGAILFALLGGGVYALLVNPILGSIIVYLITINGKKIQFSFFFNYASVKKIASFSIYQMLFNIANLSYRNIDKILIGKYFSLNALGYYEKSYRLMMLPLENISNVLNPVLHPVLADYQNNIDFIFSKYKKIVELFSWIGFPLSIFLFFCSKEIILILFGEQWHTSIILFEILSLSVGFQLVQSVVGAIFQATNNSKLMFCAGMTSLVIMLFAIIAGIRTSSMTNVALNILIAFFIIFIIYHFFLIKLALKKDILPFLRLLLYPIIYSILLGIVLILIVNYMHISNALLSLLVKSIAFLLTMSPIFIWKKNKLKFRRSIK